MKKQASVKNRPAWRYLVLLLVLSLLFMTSCSGGSDSSVGSDESKNEMTSMLRINVTPSFSSAMPIIMKELELLENYIPDGVTVEWSEIASGPDIRDSIVSGQVDIADISSSTFISAEQQDLPLVLLSNCSKAIVSVYSNRSDIKSFSDFEPTDRIAITNRATNLHSAFMAQSKQEIGDYMALDTALVPIPAADAIASLGSGSDDFDGAVFSFPNTIKAEEIDGLTLISDMSDAISEYGVGAVCCANEAFFDNNTELVEAYLKAQQEAIDYAANDPESAAELIGRVLDVPPAPVLEALEMAPLTNAIQIQAYNKQAEMMFASGAISEEATPISELKNYENLVVVE